MQKKTLRPVRYHLRVTFLPGFRKAEEKAMWKIIRTARVDEVTFFAPHAEDRSPGIGTREENEEFARWIEPQFRKLRKAKIDPSINLWWTMGFSDFPARPRDQRGQFPFRWAVSIAGKQSRTLACPQDRAWR